MRNENLIFLFPGRVRNENLIFLFPGRVRNENLIFYLQFYTFDMFSLVLYCSNTLIVTMDLNSIYGYNSALIMITCRQTYFDNKTKRTLHPLQKHRADLPLSIFCLRLE